MGSLFGLRKKLDLSFFLGSLLGALEGLSWLGLEGRADYVLGHKVTIVFVASGKGKSCVGGLGGGFG